MNFLYEGITVLEVPHELSIAFTLLGCPHHCIGCHSQEYWDTKVNKNLGQLFCFSAIRDLIENKAFKDHKDASCLVFLGGDWEMNTFLDVVMDLRRQYHRHFDPHCFPQSYKFAWYTGLEFEELESYPEVFDIFDYIKTGPYMIAKGSLRDETTNQVFWSRTFKDTTALFKRHEII